MPHLLLGWLKWMLKSLNFTLKTGSKSTQFNGIESEICKCSQTFTTRSSIIYYPIEKANAH